MTFLSSWRTALRVARREAARSKGRSLLVIAMIAVPVAALAFAAVTYDMLRLTPAEEATRTMGAAEARVQWFSRGPVVQDADGNAYSQSGPPDAGEVEEPPTEADLRQLLPAGSTVLSVRKGTMLMKTVDGVGSPNAIAVDATTPVTEGFVEVLAGRAPSTADEVALTKQAMARLGASIGDRVTSGDGSRRYTVVGEVEFPSMLQQVMLLAPLADEALEYFNQYDLTWLVDTREPVTWAQVRELNRSGVIVVSREVLLNPPPTSEVPFENTAIAAEELALGGFVAGLALLEIVLLAGPAFAVSARRRQRQLALVAANGGTPAHIRRIVLADGVFLGLVGAGVGIAIGLSAAIGARPFVEEFYSFARMGGYRFFPEALAALIALAVVTGLLAALLPAFITARQNVVASLAGRRGVTRSRKRWVLVGLAMAALGSAFVLYGTTIASTQTMLAGVIVGELGLVFCTPALVGLAARVGRLLPLAPRIALRDAARNRASAAPAISAVMAAVAGSVALGLYFTSSYTDQIANEWQELPTGYVSVYLGENQDGEVATRAEIEEAVRATVPVTSFHQTSSVTCPPGSDEQRWCYVQVVVPPERECPLATVNPPYTTEQVKAAKADDRCSGPVYYSSQTIVDDGSNIGVLSGASPEDAAAAAAMLRQGGVVLTDDRFVVDGRATLAVVDVTGPQNSDPVLAAPRVRVPAYVLTTGVNGLGAVLSERAVADAGLDTTESMLVAATTRMPTQAEQDRMGARLQSLAAFGVVQPAPSVEFPTELVILALAAALVALGAAAIGTSLAAADGRADLSTLAAVGASPRMRRILSLSQSGVIAGLGSLLGAAAGMGTAIAIIMVLNRRWDNVWPAPNLLPITIPWLNLAVALLVVPAVAMLGAGLITRSRLPIERRT